MWKPFQGVTCGEMIAALTSSALGETCEKEFWDIRIRDYVAASSKESIANEWDLRSGFLGGL